MVVTISVTAKSVSSRKQSMDKTISDCKYFDGINKPSSCPASGKTCNSKFRCKLDHFQRACKQNKTLQAKEVTIDQTAKDPDFYIASLEYKVDATNIDEKAIYAEEFCVESEFIVMNLNNKWFLSFF